MNDKVQTSTPRARYPRVLEAVFSDPWMMLPAKMAALVEVVDHRVVQGLPTPEAYIDAATGMQVSGYAAAGGAAYVLPIHGTIAQRMNMMMAFSGGVTTQEIRQELRLALADPDVGTIVLDIDSPGGSVFDIDELASEIYAGRQQKRIIAVANSLMASAAYYLGSQADEVIVTPTGQIGSIGVVMVHVDWSGANAQDGLAYTYITAGKYKAEGNQDQPLTEEARAFFQSQVDEYYRMFVEAVARGRGVSVDDVRNGFGQGRVLGAQAAVDAGLADDIAPIGEVISRLNTRADRSVQRRQARAVVD